ncbi:phosphoribosyl 1,2-cyclic phosphodiesterase [Rhizobium sp. Root274]|uniref:MBL fold metallo-hydrolase n=1 Tax=unclassified Rhizobium TaxID=2613769 RepID=UPI00071468C5|nr:MULTISPECIES: MBL fold metallo-hydrolase [unclassified Rhizobium]KQW27021.1 phosphoribosyl 1,2-cyclic phosphodiesterase [Rhizobium sp. Root1240]KRD27917.1 phosphoribosyl 1,2-cyclic phosphodiesterase [Rhizobium sp. Root274]
MKVTRRFTLLGCSSSPGVPRINGDWGNCDPSNPKNRRTRASFLIEQIGPDGGKTVVVIDTGPDFRDQMIRSKVEFIDAVIYSHAHADHLHGIDDLRGYFHSQHKRIPIHAEPFTMARIEEGFGYCLKTPAGSAYPPIVEPHLMEDLSQPIVITGAGGPISLLPLKQQHGDIISIGLRIGDVAYCCDVSDFPDETVAKLSGLDLLFIDALQYRPHPSHLSLEQALAWISRFGPKRAVLTHMHTPLDYDTVMGETPANVEPGHDQFSVEFQCDTGLI